MPSLHRILFGNPLRTSAISSEKLDKKKALAIFSSDVLSSVAYASEEILIVLSSVAVGLCHLSIPIALCIGLLILIVVISYWQTIQAYPTGGGAFDVVRKNLGEIPGLITGAALMIDYTLTVAVSLAAGTKAVTSLCPALTQYHQIICLCALLFVVWANIRGTQASASILSIPTYCFITSVMVMICYGIITPAPQHTIPQMPDISTLLLTTVLIRAFASGCSALTGIEAIASGVNTFQKPEFRNAQITLAIMGSILFTMFIGITFLAYKFSITPNYTETVISQIAHQVFGNSAMYYVMQICTAMILLLAANTSFSGFPRLASVLAKANYIPTRFAMVGDRLAYTNGILLLATIASLLLFFFRGDTHALIPLYSIGVFISFTLSQLSMIIHWKKSNDPQKYLKAAINTFGAIATFVALLTIVESKFLVGAWFVLILIPMFSCLFKKINLSYRYTKTRLDPQSGGLGSILRTAPFSQTTNVIVPVAKIHKGTLSAIEFATSLSKNVVAVMVNIDSHETAKIRLAWQAMKIPVPLIILDSPYRSIITPLLDFIDEIDQKNPDGIPAIVITPSFVPTKWWERFLHNQTITLLKNALIMQRKREHRIIVDVPYHI